MNLAVKDIRHNLITFVLASVGIGLLLLASMTITGLFLGLVEDAFGLIESPRADLWVVQGGTEGPFSEGSSIPRSTVGRLLAIDGVESVRQFTITAQKFRSAGRIVRGSILGVDVPIDDCRWLHLVAGRSLTDSRGEAVADRGLELRVGEMITLGHETIEVVGLARDLVDSSGNPVLAVSIGDALAIAAYRAPEAVRAQRAANPAGGPKQSSISAVLVRLAPGADRAAVRRAIERAGDLSAYTTQEEKDILLLGRLGRLRKQILLFTITLLLISGVVVSLTVYNLTLAKLHEIAVLKLIGAENWVLMKMIGQQAILIGAAAFGLAVAGAYLLLPLYPRRILITPAQFAAFGSVCFVICTAGSLFGIRRALKVRAQSILS